MAVSSGKKRANVKYIKEKTTKYSITVANNTSNDVIQFMESLESKTNTIATLIRYYLHRSKHNLSLHGYEIALCDIGKHKEEIDTSENEIRLQLEPALLEECEASFEIDTPFYLILMEYLYRTDKDVIVP